MKIINKVELTAEEKKALSIINNISCKGITCDICPFNVPHVTDCVISLTREVWYKYCKS